MGKINESFRQRCMNDPELKSPVHDEMTIWIRNNAREYIRTALNLDPMTPCVCIKNTLEAPVSTASKFIVGFLDVRVVTCMPTGSKYWLQSGYITQTFCWGFEAKPKIPSLGELLRQLQTYKTHLNSPQHKYRFVVVSPDTRYRDDILTEGFAFWEYPLSL